MRLEQSTAPTIEPVTLAEVKNYCRIDEDRDDALIDSLIEAARDQVETRAGRQLITATWNMYLPDFPSIIRLPRPPLQSVTSITYVDSAGDAQTESATVYTADTKSEPGLIHEAYSQSWSTHRADADDVVTVTYVAGYGDAGTDVPEELKIALMMLVRSVYDGTPEPPAVNALISLRACGWIW